MNKPKINTLITTVNKSKRSTKFNNKGYLVCHYVGSVSSARNNAKYFYNVNRQASAHFFVDDNEIWQVVPVEYWASWHCGGGRQSSKGGTYYGKCTNNNSIGIEMCCKKDKNGKLYISEKTIARTATLVKWLMATYDIPIDHIIRHFDVTGKNCPAGYTTASAWKELKAKLCGTSYKALTGMNIRKSPSLDAKIVGTVAKGEIIAGEVVPNNWLKTVHGYVRIKGKETYLKQV